MKSAIRSSRPLGADAHVPAGMASAWTEVLSHYTVEQLTVILDLFQRMGELSSRQVEQLRQSGR